MTPGTGSPFIGQLKDDASSLPRVRSVLAASTTHSHGSGERRELEDFLAEIDAAGQLPDAALDDIAAHMVENGLDAREAAIEVVEGAA